MTANERLYPLLERWVAEAEAGRLLSITDLCRDTPELLPQVEGAIAVLRQFHDLARPSGVTTGEWQAAVDTTTGVPARPVPVGSLPEPGATFGRYRIVAELGHGGMGIVCKARDTQLERDVAIKIMRPEVASHPLTADRFLREARALAAVRHDHVVEVYDYGVVDGVPFVVMPLLAGETLAQRLARQAPLPTADVLRLAVELTDGLAAVHAQGLIHRDLKPSNVWLETPRGRVKLLDFGLARDPGSGEGLTLPGAVVGTPAYMSPEQANGLTVDARSDLFSLGSVLYQAATGRCPFAAPTVTATLVAVGEKEAPPARSVNPDVPAAFSTLIERLHRKDPVKRPASAVEVAGQLHSLTSEPVTVTADRLSGARGGLRRRSRWTLAACLAGALALAGVVALCLTLANRFGNRSVEAEDARNPPVTDRGLGDMTPTHRQQPDPTGRNGAEPVRVRKLEVFQLPNRDDRRTEARRRFGDESFGATSADDMKAEAELSRPAYCFLIVFRADGLDQVLYPQDDQDVPQRTEKPQYPSKDRNKVYGLSDGPGLWIVALVASDEPLPCYAVWRQQHRANPWFARYVTTSTVGALGAPGPQTPYLAASMLLPSKTGPWTRADEANVIWLDDGQWLEALTPRGNRSRGARGQKDASGPSPVVRLVDWLRAETHGTVSAVGFTVEAKE